MEVSEEKANQRVEEFKREMKTLTVRLKEAENRAESAEKQVKRLQKEVDRLEGMPMRINIHISLYKLFIKVYFYHQGVVKKALCILKIEFLFLSSIIQYIRFV